MSNVLALICFSELQKELFEGRGEIVKYISGVQDSTSQKVRYKFLGTLKWVFRHRFKTTFHLFESNV
jgi:hypothetical protein